VTIPKTLALYAVTGAALCASLTACVSPQAPNGPKLPPPSPTAGAEATPGLSDADLFLTAARAVAPDLAVVDDSTLTNLGESVCNAFDAGATSGMVAKTMLGSGMDATAAGAVVGAATSTLCPEHKADARA
jgi:hypothetical protein